MIFFFTAKGALLLFNIRLEGVAIIRYLALASASYAILWRILTLNLAIREYKPTPFPNQAIFSSKILANMAGIRVGKVNNVLAIADAGGDGARPGYDGLLFRRIAAQHRT